MARGGMVIDVLTAPSEEEGLEEEPASEEPSRRQEPEAIIASIEAQLAQLRAAVAGL